jgi:hypothetical protein
MPALPQLYPYKSGPMEPVVMPGETVGIWVNKVFNFFKVDYIDGIMFSDPLTMDFGAVAAGANTQVTQLALLEMPDVEFGQFRAEVLDDLPGAMSDPDGAAGEFYVHEDNWAYMQIFNQTGYALTQTRVAFWGFRYVCTALPEYSWATKTLPPVWTRIPATAHL